MPKALITGITGQDGSYLAELLLRKGYEVHGIVRQASSFQRTRIDHLSEYRGGSNPRLTLHYGDMGDAVSLVKLIYDLQPDEIYNLAGQSHVRVSFEIPEYTYEVTANGTLHILEAVRESGMADKTRFYQASSSEMFGGAGDNLQNECTPFHPRSPYACAKTCAHYMTVNYREAYGLFACCGILFNHESPRRAENFVTRKITRAVGRIKAGLDDKLRLGNLDARRDWGYAKEYVEAMWLMLQQKEPQDFVIATGEAHSVEEFLETSFARAQLDWQDHVEFDERLLRPVDVAVSVGDCSKARDELGWEPQLRMHDLVRLMTDHDIELAESEL